VFLHVRVSPLRFSTQIGRAEKLSSQPVKARWTDVHFCNRLYQKKAGAFLELDRPILASTPRPAAIAN